MSGHAFDALGAFTLLWASFEFRLEVLAHRLMGTKPAVTSILCATLGFGAKQEIVLALLKEAKPENHEETAASVRKISTMARRNHIMHSIVANSAGWQDMSFWKRDISPKLKLRPVAFNKATFKGHFDEMAEEVKRFENLCSMSLPEIQGYFDALKATHQIEDVR